MREDIDEWLEKLTPYIEELNYHVYFATLKAMMTSGTSSERQRKVFNLRSSFEDVVKHNVSEFLLQVPLYDFNKSVFNDLLGFQ